MTAKSKLLTDYEHGYLACLATSAWWRDRTQYVGVGHMTLAQAKRQVMEGWATGQTPEGLHEPRLVEALRALLSNSRKPAGECIYCRWPGPKHGRHCPVPAAQRLLAELDSTHTGDSQ